MPLPQQRPFRSGVALNLSGARHIRALTWDQAYPPGDYTLAVSHDQDTSVRRLTSLPPSAVTDVNVIVPPRVPFRLVGRRQEVNGPVLHGRATELAAIDRILDRAQASRSTALVVRGETGIGKSALLDHAAAAAAARGMRVLRGCGVQQEMELPFAGLHLLLHAALDRLAQLPAPQARALRGALGLSADVVADRFLIGVAVLTLLEGLAEQRPLVCLVDDAHWLDHASAEALLFAARRLGAEGVALIFASRDHPCPFPASGLQEMRLGRLDDAAAAKLLTEQAIDLAPQVRDRVLLEAQGNPLALVELPATFSPQQRSGEQPPPGAGTGPMAPSGRVLDAFRDRLSALPDKTRTLMLVAAADDTGRLEVVLEAARRLGASVADTAPAEAARLLHIDDGRLVFRHPLARSAAYQQAPLADRLAAHRALAGALEGRADDLDRRAWHLASAATGPDEHAAAALVLSAEQARMRGGYAAVAAAYERAAQLSPAPADRAHRMLSAARAAADAGHHAEAHHLVDLAVVGLTTPAALAQAARVRATVANAQGDPKAAHALLAEAAETLAVSDQEGAAVLFFEAITSAWAATEFAAAAHTARRAAALLPSPTGHAGPLLRAASGLARLSSEEPARALTWLRDLIDGLHASGRTADLQERARLAIWDLVTGDDDAAYDHAVAIERDCRAQGAVGVLPLALALVARTQVYRGFHRDAAASAEEGLRIVRDTLHHHEAAALLTGVLAYLAAMEGDEERCLSLVEQVRHSSDAGARGMGFAALTILDLALGRYEAAVRRAEEHSAALPGGRLMLTLHRASDLVEAAVRAERPDFAHTVAAWLHAWAEHTGQSWAKAVSLRCRALLASGKEAEQNFVAAVRLHHQGGRPFERARTELLYGEWLRRARRRADARLHLKSAMEIFQQLGARPWAERTQSELRATGERQAHPADGSAVLDRLTPQELQIVRMAATGMTNREIAALLFLSPRTVGYHLYKAYPKLGITSRGELARLGLHPDS
ncbi:AAA family ATPase [Nonomuraea sp. NPDC050202]|jgi:DNA-binding CsgD family transcriptional regulator|uniref:AAA family ATPase n=1 Tax=Nonomuraea sp. NPDC050202 TaxID=3155035 RepID=UPI003404F47D